MPAPEYDKVAVLPPMSCTWVTWKLPSVISPLTIQLQTVALMGN